MKRFLARWRESRFPMSLFWIILGVMLLTAGIHAGMLIGMEQAGWPELIVVHIIVLYWLLIALGLTLFIRWRMKQVYDKPLKKISEAAGQVAKGDFTVRVEPFHTPDRWDYLDRMTMDLNAMIQELGSIETLKTDFVSNVSHEMKTPLSIIKNYAELMQAEDLSEEHRIEYAAAIESAAGRMSDLITNILRLNRLEHQTILPEVKEYDLCRQLVDCILRFEDRWEEKQIDLDVDVEDQAMIRADESLLELVWNNLLSNAVKFTPVGGTISVRQRSEGDSITVSIADTGCGMDEETRKHIFDRFYQGDTSHATEGNGLGLALVARVLTLMHGEISVDSAPGQGSTFTVHLPRGIE